jgi:16S rRNA (uracil1498-N3)-methyltransferase
MSSTPPRFTINSAAVRFHEAVVSGSELHHLRDVLRMRAGASVGLVDERGRHFKGRIARIDSAGALIRIESGEEPRGAPPLIIALALIKGPRMDLAIEKAAELGASAVWPFVSERCTVRDPGHERLARWRRLAAAGCKQSLAVRPVEVEAPMDFSEVAARAPEGMLRVICQAGAPPLARVLGPRGAGGVLIVCGPEGDFTPQEAAAAQAAGFVSASLGRNRLRTETAVLAALAIAASVMEEWT